MRIRRTALPKIGRQRVEVLSYVRPIVATRKDAAQLLAGGSVVNNRSRTQDENDRKTP